MAKLGNTSRLHLRNSETLIEYRLDSKSETILDLIRLRKSHLHNLNIRILYKSFRCDNTVCSLNFL